MLPVNSPCTEWQGWRNRKGYGQYCDPGTVYAHRAAYCEAHGLILDDIKGRVVRHKCDNPGCVNPDHLELGTQLDNIRDRVERGRNARLRGESNGNAKLTTEQVREIRAVYVPRSRENNTFALAKRYGVSQPLVSAIVTGRAWKHLLEDE